MWKIERKGLQCIFRPMDRIIADMGSITSISSSCRQIASFMTRARCVQILYMPRVSSLKCVVLYVATGRLMDGTDFSVVTAVAPCR